MRSCLLPFTKILGLVRQTSSIQVGDLIDCKPLMNFSVGFSHNETVVRNDHGPET